MALNKELLAMIRLAETNHGDVENWPKDDLKKMQVLANREKNPKSYMNPGEKEEVRELAERGFDMTTMCIILHRSRAWIRKRWPEKIEYKLIDEDRQFLKYHKGTKDKEIARELKRDLNWIKEVRKQL